MAAISFLCIYGAGSDYTERHSIALANSPYLKNLTALSLWRNEIRDEGGKAIAESKTFAKLERLYMSLNLIDRPVRKIIRKSELAGRLKTLVMD